MKFKGDQEQEQLQLVSARSRVAPEGSQQPRWLAEEREGPGQDQSDQQELEKSSPEAWSELWINAPSILSCKFECQRMAVGTPSKCSSSPFKFTLMFLPFLPSLTFSFFFFLFYNFVFSAENMPFIFWQMRQFWSSANSIHSYKSDLVSERFAPGNLFVCVPLTFDPFHIQ